jgi:Tol biopolymer transport system component
VANVASGRVHTIVGEAGWSLWSPRDERIAVSALATSNNPEVYTIRADGKQRRRLTHARGYDFPVAWSRDGKRLAFTSNRQNLGGGPLEGLFVMDVTGRHQRRVGTGRQADWNPSGRRLAYSDGRDLYTVGVDGRGRRLIARAAAVPAWSPDGKWIAFQGPGGIELVQPDGSGRHALLPAVPDVGSPEA